MNDSNGLNGWRRVWLALAGLGGAAGIALAAYDAHGSALAPEAASWLEKATRYQMIHVLALLGLAALPGRTGLSRIIAGAAFAVGIVCFSGSLAGMALLGWPVTPLVPFGGSLFIAGWLCLALSAWRR